MICAWCQQEGRSGLLRVCEPLDDTTDTHGIFERHQQEVFEAFPSTSFPSTRWLFIVPSGDIARYEHMVNLLRDVPGATVIVDRRHGERRRAPASATPDRRRLERRVRRPQTNSLGYALVRFAPRQGTRSELSTPAGAPEVPDVAPSAGKPWEMWPFDKVRSNGRNFMVARHFINGTDKSCASQAG